MIGTAIVSKLVSIWEYCHELPRKDESMKRCGERSTINVEVMASVALNNQIPVLIILIPSLLWE